ncbi:hypothetical protein [Stappia indica]|uniref:hypothetical protein n=1 Tax=Stappia indica TaxID=538381 RepID=UPI001CD5FF45|nr:hypothetical protein [Stappia indica]MCA1299458.1 hypothetical protein [Stappia indica]
MTGCDDRNSFNILAYRREGGEGWHIEETWADLDTFKANRGNIGMPCAEVRFVGTVWRLG